MTRIEEAQLIWQVLVGAADIRRIITYSILADAIGSTPGTLAQSLGIVMRYCEGHKLPPLTVLVVNKETGLPGVGLRTVEQIGKDREDVFAHDWYRFPPPSTEDFGSVARESPDASPAGGAKPQDAHVREQRAAALDTGVTGAELNAKWRVGAKHALYHHEGNWYHQLRDFPGAFFDQNGYVLFETEESFLRSPYLKIRQDVNVRGSIADIPGYVRVR